MTENAKESIPINNNEMIREEVNLQFHWYMINFFVTYLLSWIIPVFIFIIYVRFFFYPHFLETKSFVFLITEILPLIALVSMPFVFIGCYLIHVFFV
ncbi:MAG: hypothetical protein KGD70_16755, partial [Candidatus Lokiarchaeota archaeon]|nr:hypothetical protein [Candidatus Lokiarchaeota archaeon]